MLDRRNLVRGVAMGGPSAVIAAAGLAATASAQTVGPSGFVAVTDFDAKGDGSTNDRAAIQAALDSGRNVYFPPGNYYVAPDRRSAELGILSVRSGRCLLFGLGGARVPENPLDPSSGDTSKTIALIFTDQNRPLFHVSGHNVTFSGLNLIGPGYEQYPNSAGIVFQKTNDNTDDVDARVIDCGIRHFNVGVRVVGRGLRAERNVFFSLAVAIETRWPGGGVNTEGDPLQEVDTGGMRAYYIFDNRVHSCRRFVVNEGSRSHNFLWGMDLANNLIDVGDHLFSGGAIYSRLCGNIVCHPNKVPLYLNGACHHTTISGNVLAGHPAITDRQPDHAIWVDTGSSFHDVTIDHNVIANTGKDGLKLDGKRCDHVAISGNTFDNIGGGNRGHHAIFFGSRARDVSIVGNTFKLGGNSRKVLNRMPSGSARAGNVHDGTWV